MDIARINLSHGSEDEQRVLVEKLRRVAKELDSPLGILLDLPGPKIRLGKLKEKVISLRKGKIINIVEEDILGDERRVSLNFPQIIKGIKENSFIYLNDGLIKLKVLKVKDKEVVCLVENSGEIMSGKGVNIPGTSLERYIGEEENIKKILFAKRLQPDFVGISFVKNKKDILKVKDILGKDIFIIAKIEKKEAIKNIDEIIEESDGVMVARGDLGIETSLEELPILQKEIIEKANLKGKIAIVATQILESMLDSPLPTRAEVTDIANAILDGADCLMLSEETALGKYPVEAVSTLRRVSLIAEKNFPHKKYLTQRIEKNISILEAIAYSSVWTTYQLEADAIVVPTLRGETARWISKFRPHAPIFALTSEKKIFKKLNIFWGVHPLYFPFRISPENLPEKIESLLKKFRFLKRGERIIITGSNLRGREEKTNLIQVHEIG